MSSGEETMPSPYRNPAASSKSAPGVRMVTATVCLESPEIRRISIGSSVARVSGRTRAWPSSNTRTRTLVLLPRRALFVLVSSSICAPLVSYRTHRAVYQCVVVGGVHATLKERPKVIWLGGLSPIACERPLISFGSAATADRLPRSAALQRLAL